MNHAMIDPARAMIRDVLAGNWTARDALKKELGWTGDPESLCMTDVASLRRTRGVGRCTLHRLVRIAYLLDPHCTLVRSFMDVEQADDEAADVEQALERR